MKTLFSISIPLLLVLLLIGTAPQVEARGKHSKLSPEETFNKKDVNHDGQLTRTEFLAGIAVVLAGITAVYPAGD